MKGTINGHIEHVYAEFSGELSKENIKVEIIGKNISATTDSEGRFSLKNVPTGTYDIKFTRSDIAYFELHDINILGGNTPVVIKDEINMIQKSTTSITDFNVQKNNNYLYLSADIEPNDTISRLIIFCLSKKNNIYIPTHTQSSNDPDFIEMWAVYSEHVPFYIEIEDYWYSDTLYANAYGASELYNKVFYKDKETGTIICPGVNYEGAPEVKRFIFTSKNN